MADFFIASITLMNTSLTGMKLASELFSIFTSFIQFDGDNRNDRIIELICGWIGYSSGAW
jgi:hypothetical protein